MSHLSYSCLPPKSSENDNNSCFYYWGTKKECYLEEFIIRCSTHPNYYNNYHHHYYYAMLENHPAWVFYVVKVMNLLLSPLFFVNTYCFSSYISKLMCIFMLRVTISFAQTVQKKWETLSRRAEDSTLEAWPSEKASSLAEGLLKCQVTIFPGSVQVKMLRLNTWNFFSKGLKENVCGKSNKNKHEVFEKDKDKAQFWIPTSDLSFSKTSGKKKRNKGRIISRDICGNHQVYYECKWILGLFGDCQDLKEE